MLIEMLVNKAYLAGYYMDNLFLIMPSIVIFDIR